MAFDSTKYKPKQGKFLPVLLLLDQSASMGGDKIQALNQATQEMIEAFASVSNEDVEILLGVISFSRHASLTIPFTPAKELHQNPWQPLNASGSTAMGEALTMAFDLLQDSHNLPKNIYRPAVVLVSDGQPNDSWQQPLDNFVQRGRSAKCQRFAIAIGADVDLSLLEQFTGQKANLLQATDAQGLKAHFSFITQTVSQRSASLSPNAIPISNSTSTLSSSVSSSSSTSASSTSSVSVAEPFSEEEDTGGSPEGEVMEERESLFPSETEEPKDFAQENDFEDFQDFQDFDPDAL